ncbi:MAG: hypothetical protein GTO55_08700 [Armatimonadetes bacterium]|nr:hypothetical protein [Armatimonadota bacterium]NIM24325.1 hypothetical protein [Armatimonadota bacterium]NIM68194.1 hypothetical protein [Armatimonadota bacterium]NIM76654.1 hypothetical protein [Armatimonadota bacterium]NIN06399.1 hypothetical protein [Armatimonadota bacterium]
MSEQSRIIYEEVQYSRQWWLWVVIIGSGLLPAGIVAWMIIQQLIFARPIGENPMSDQALMTMGALVFAFDAALIALFLAANLRTEVRIDGLYIRYFPFHLSFRKVPLENAAKVEALTYNPIQEYGGWGIRFRRKGRAYNPTGNRGVRLEYMDGRHILLGSQRPDELKEAIESLRQ